MVMTPEKQNYYNNLINIHKLYNNKTYDSYMLSSLYKISLNDVKDKIQHFYKLCEKNVFILDEYEEWIINPDYSSVDDFIH